MKAVDLIPKLVTARYTGDEHVTVTLRYARGAPAMQSAQRRLTPIYGSNGSFTLIQRGDPDKLGELLDWDEVAVRAQFPLDEAIQHLMSLPPSTPVVT